MTIEEGKLILEQAGALYEPEISNLRERTKRAIFLERINLEINPFIDRDKPISRQTMWNFLTGAIKGETLGEKPVSVRFVTPEELKEAKRGLEPHEFVFINDVGNNPWIIFFKQNTLYFGKRA